MSYGSTDCRRAGTNRPNAAADMPAPVSIPEAQPYTLRDLHRSPDILANMSRLNVAKLLHVALTALAKHEGWDKPKTSRKPVSK